MLSIPIISEFDGKGIDKAVKEFKQLETVGEKAQFAIKKAAVAAAAALVALTAALGAALKAAIEDEAQAAQLALTLRNVTGATEEQVKATEDMISAMSRASGTADSELRPALAVLVTGTKDITVATEALAIAQDIAIGSNKSLVEVADALAKAYGGNMKGLQALSPEIKAMIKDGASLDEVMQVLTDTFGGAAAIAADTAAGKFQILKNSLDETKESIGAALLPAVEAVLPILQEFADWAQENPEAFLAIAAAIGAIALAVVALNIAMSANPFTLIAIGLAAVVTGLIVAYTKFETFRNIVNNTLNGLIAGFESFANSIIGAINVIIDGINAISPFTDIPNKSYVSIPRIGAPQGIVAPPNPPKSMPTPTGPLVTPGGGGGGGGASSQGPGFAPVNGPIGFVGGIQERIANRPDITINVSGGISSSTDIGQAVVDALTQYTQVYGPLDLAIR